MGWLGGATWWEALKAALLSLPFFGWLLKRRAERADAKAETKRKDADHEAAADLDPDRLGDRLRRRLHGP